MLNKWMHAILANLSRFPIEAQLLVSEFLALKNDDGSATEATKNLILKVLNNETNAVFCLLP
jgi:hypothetical protein